MPITINDAALSDYHLALMPPLEAWFHAPRAVRRGEPVSEMLASVPAARRTTDIRSLVLYTLLRATTLAERHDRLVAVEDWLGAGLNRIERLDSPGKLVRAEFLGAEVRPLADTSVFYLESVQVILSFAAWDAASYARQPAVLTVGTTPVAVPMGTLGTLGRIIVPGGWSGSRTVTYRGVNGLSYGTLTLTVPADQTFAAGEHVVLDLARWRATRVSATRVRTNVYHWLTGGDWFALERTDADPARNRWPTLAMSAGTAQYEYRTAWRY